MIPGFSQWPASDFDDAEWQLAQDTSDIVGASNIAALCLPFDASPSSGTVTSYPPRSGGGPLAPLDTGWTRVANSGRIWLSPASSAVYGIGGTLGVAPIEIHALAQGYTTVSGYSILVSDSLVEVSQALYPYPSTTLRVDGVETSVVPTSGYHVFSATHASPRSASILLGGYSSAAAKAWGSRVGPQVYLTSALSSGARSQLVARWLAYPL